MFYNSFVENPQTFICRTTQKHEINPISVHKILKQYKFTKYDLFMS